MNKPPAAASKMLTLTTSPMPNLISGGGRWSPKIPVRVCGPYSSRMLTMLAVSGTTPYGGPCQVSPYLTTRAFGPAAGNSNVSPHPLVSNDPPTAAAKATNLPTVRRMPLSPHCQGDRYHLIHDPTTNRPPCKHTCGVPAQKSRTVCFSGHTPFSATYLEAGAAQNDLSGVQDFAPAINSIMRNLLAAPVTICADCVTSHRSK